MLAFTVTKRDIKFGTVGEYSMKTYINVSDLFKEFIQILERNNSKDTIKPLEEPSEQIDEDVK